jgi:hypothetical protein
MKTYIGIDNGVTGSIGIVDTSDNTSHFIKMPTFSQQSYTKKKQNITRIDVKKLTDILSNSLALNSSYFLVIERPMINPRRFKASMSAIRALEATLNVIETLDIPYQYIDSKEWQRDLLPQGIKGSDELKKASSDIGLRLFPIHKALIEKQKDADGILIAEWARRKGL